MRYLLAAAAAIVAAVPGEAAVVTRSFQVTASRFANFDGVAAPFRSLVANFQVTYDDSVDGTGASPDSFAVLTDGRPATGPFAAVPLFRHVRPDGMSLMPRLIVGGAINGIGTLANRTDDFFISFDASPTATGAAMLGFTTATDRVGFSATDARVVELPATAAIPEPATWAMMTAGFGAIAWRLRRRTYRRPLAV